MKTRIAAFGVILAPLALATPAGAPAAGPQTPSAARGGGVSGIRVGVTCHDPCDDPFQVKAWVEGAGATGLAVKFVVNGRSFTARTARGGYAHAHLVMTPSAYPQGVVFTVRASVTHAGATKSATTWFKPNYE